ncbi:putative ABC transport system permease protein [Dysgonomonas alginatilytica]|uniref:Putative ABC transport system permease protein n=1 Tax=Dysgonomonas alginatilytica TaxID=1605892 RepID=A0A2V3PZS3_9BACT|nr:ABC transporter permease [Dysgonomonas alginatilytica]PXV68035.1 putative ABC transport system permease protein [Dysgonomonas alginatilytica]
MKAIFLNFLHVIKRFKTASVLNILGLSAALVVFTICAIQTYCDLTFNNSLKNADRLYQLSIYQDTNYGKWWNFDMYYKYSEIIRVNQPKFNASNMVRVISSTDLSVKYKNKGEQFNTKVSVTSVEPQFLDIIGLYIIEGNGSSTLADINKVIISEKTAKRLFGDKSAMGELISVSMPTIHRSEDGLSNSWDYVMMPVCAVYKDFPTNTSFDNGIFTRLAPDRFEGFSPEGSIQVGGNFRTYYLLDNNQKLADLETILTDKKLLDLINLVPPQKEDIKNAKGEGDCEVLKKGLELTPLCNIHISHPETVGQKAKSWSSILALMAIGAVTLLIAYINFMNFITAMAPMRIRSINIQKILGARRDLLGISIVLETLMFTFFSFAIALSAVYYISTSVIANFFTASLLLKDNVAIIIGLGIILTLVSLLVALYPAFYLTSFNPVAGYGGAGAGKDGKQLRNVLTTIQFAAASILILVTLFIKLQHEYFRSYDLGMNSENVLVVNNKDLDWQPLLNDASAYMQEVTGTGGIVNSTASSFRLGSGIPKFGFMVADKQIMYSAMEGSKNFLDFFGIEVLEGKENLDNKEKEKIEAVNQKMINQYGTEVVENKIVKVSAVVVSDFNFMPLYEDMSPLSIVLYDNPKYSNIYFKVSGENTDKSIKHLETKWKEFTTAPFEYHFMNELVDNLYKQESNLASLLSIFSLTAILIAIMGVYGLVTFNSKYRAKEIAIRKVQGSTIEQIMLLLNKGMLTQFVTAFIIAVPIAHYIVSKWLEQFAYKTPIYWWVFLLGALIVLLITILTVSVQSYRAATANPIGALKNE